MVIVQAPATAEGGEGFALHAHQERQEACEALQANLREEYRAVLGFDTAFQQVRLPTAVSWECSPVAGKTSHPPQSASACRSRIAVNQL